MKKFFTVLIMLVLAALALSAQAEGLESPCFTNVSDRETIEYTDYVSEDFELRWNTVEGADSYDLWALVLDGDPDPGSSSEQGTRIDEGGFHLHAGKQTFELDSWMANRWLKFVVRACGDGACSPATTVYLWLDSQYPEIRIASPADGDVFTAGDEVNLSIQGSRYHHYFYSLTRDGEIVQQDTMEKRLNTDVVLDEPGEYRVYAVATTSKTTVSSGDSSRNGLRDEAETVFTVLPQPKAEPDPQHDDPVLPWDENVEETGWTIGQDENEPAESEPDPQFSEGTDPEWEEPVEETGWTIGQDQSEPDPELEAPDFDEGQFEEPESARVALNVKGISDGGVFTTDDWVTISVSGEYDHFYLQIDRDGAFWQNRTEYGQYEEDFRFDEPGQYQLYVVATDSATVQRDGDSSGNGNRVEKYISFTVKETENQPNPQHDDPVLPWDENVEETGWTIGQDENEPAESEPDPQFSEGTDPEWEEPAEETGWTIGQDQSEPDPKPAEETNTGTTDQPQSQGTDIPASASVSVDKTENLVGETAVISVSATGSRAVLEIRTPEGKTELLPVTGLNLIGAVYPTRYSLTMEGTYYLTVTAYPRTDTDAGAVQAGKRIQVSAPKAAAQIDASKPEFTAGFDYSEKTIPIGESWIPEGTISLSGGTGRLGIVTINSPDAEAVLTENFSDHAFAETKFQDWAAYRIDTAREPWNKTGTYRIRVWAKDDSGQGGTAPLAEMKIIITDARAAVDHSYAGSLYDRRAKEVMASSEYQNASQAEQLVQVARSQVGYKQDGFNTIPQGYAGVYDGTGNGTTQTTYKYTEYGRLIGNRDDWCASFISWCAAQVGISQKIIPFTALAGDFRIKNHYTPLWDSTYTKLQPVVPEIGDIVTFMPYDRVDGYYNAQHPSSHVGIVYDIAADRDGVYKIGIVEGNAGGQVKDSRFLRLDAKNGNGSRVLQGICKPPYDGKKGRAQQQTEKTEPTDAEAEAGTDMQQTAGSSHGPDDIPAIHVNRYDYDLTGTNSSRERMEKLKEIFAEDTFADSRIPEQYRSSVTCWNNWVYFSNWEKYLKNTTSGSGRYSPDRGYTVYRVMFGADGSILRKNDENEKTGLSLIAETKKSNTYSNAEGVKLPENFAYEVVRIGWQNAAGEAFTRYIVTERRTITYYLNGQAATYVTTVSNAECPAAGTNDGTHHSVLNSDYKLSNCTCGFFDGGGQCLGFAKMIFTMAYGKKPSDCTNMLAKGGKNKTVQYGDYVRADGHSYIILEGEADQIVVVNKKNVTKKGVIVFDANRKGGSCAISYTHSNRRIVNNVEKTSWYRFEN